MKFNQRYKIQQKDNCNRKLTDAQVLQIYEEHLFTGVSVYYLAVKAGVTKGALNNRFRLLDLKSLGTKGKMEHRFFNIIDNEIKAYLLGFLFGDGCVSRNTNAITVELSIKDRYIIDLFHQLNPNLKLLSRIKGKSETLKIGLTSKIMKSDLLNKGVKINKTYDGMLIQNVDRLYYPHLIRGFMDADGCVFCKKQRLNIVILACSSLDFIMQISRYLSSVDIIHTITADIREHKLTIYHLNICKDVTKFYHLIYDNANFWLKRKRDKFIGNTEVTIEPKNLIAP